MTEFRVEPVVFGRRATDTRWLSELTEEYRLLSFAREIPDGLRQGESADAFGGTLGRIDTFLHGSGAVPATNPDVSIAIAYRNPEPKVAAARWLGSGTEFLITLDVGIVARLHGTARRLWAFLHDGDSGSLLAQPGVSSKQAVDEIASSAVLLLFFHELAHVRRRHFEALAVASFAEGGLAMASSAGEPDIRVRAIEIDADLHGAIHLGLLWRLNLRQSHDTQFAFGVLAAWVLFDVLLESAGWGPTAHYHSPKVRLESLLRGFAGAYGLTQAEMERGRGAFFESLARTLMSRRVDHSEPWVRRLYHSMDAEPQGSGPLREDYRRGRAILQEDLKEFDRTEAQRVSFEKAGLFKDLFDTSP